MDPYELLLKENRRQVCRKCGGMLRKKEPGVFECVKCREIVLDDFGKVNKYIAEHGLQPAELIARETGANMREVNRVLQKARLMHAGKTGGVCMFCGKPVAFGSLCSDCQGKTDGRKEAALEAAAAAAAAANAGDGDKKK